MRYLRFIINGQQIQMDPACDFTGIVAGSRGYLKAHFTFTQEWDGCILVASFMRGGSECAVQIINGECDIPSEVLTGATFKVSVMGQRNNYRILTNTVTIRQEVH